MLHAQNPKKEGKRQEKPEARVKEGSPYGVNAESSCAEGREAEREEGQKAEASQEAKGW